MAIDVIHDDRPLIAWKHGSQKIALYPLADGVIYLIFSAQCFNIQSRNIPKSAQAQEAGYRYWEAATAMLNRVCRSKVRETTYYNLWKQHHKPNHQDYGEQAFYNNLGVTSTAKEREKLILATLQEFFPEFYHHFVERETYYKLLEACALWSLDGENVSPASHELLLQEVEKDVFFNLWDLKGRPSRLDFGRHAFYHNFGCSSTAWEKYESLFLVLRSKAPKRLTLLDLSNLRYADLSAITQLSYDEQKGLWTNESRFVRWTEQRPTISNLTCLKMFPSQSCGEYHVSLCCNEEGKKVWKIEHAKERSLELDPSAETCMESLTLLNFLVQKQVYDCIGKGLTHLRAELPDLVQAHASYLTSKDELLGWLTSHAFVQQVNQLIKELDDVDIDAFKRKVALILMDYTFQIQPKDDTLQFAVELKTFDSVLSPNNKVDRDTWAVTLASEGGSTPGDGHYGHAVIYIETVVSGEFRVQKWQVSQLDDGKHSQATVSKRELSTFDPNHLSCKSTTWKVKKYIVDNTFPDSLHNTTINFAVIPVFWGQNCLSWAIKKIRELEINVAHPKSFSAPNTFIQSL